MEEEGKRGGGSVKISAQSSGDNCLSHHLTRLKHPPPSFITTLTNSVSGLVCQLEDRGQLVLSVRLSHLHLVPNLGVAHNTMMEFTGHNKTVAELHCYCLQQTSEFMFEGGAWVRG